MPFSLHWLRSDTPMASSESWRAQVASLRFGSQCEHHMLPFFGEARVLFVTAPAAAQLVPGTLEALLDVCSHRLQIQERLTQELASAVHAATGAPGPCPSSASLSPARLALRSCACLCFRCCACDIVCGALAGAAATLVVCEAVHMCMVARGVEKHASSTVTCATRGACSADGELRAELLQLLNSASFC
jgi:GTP cyclohydrolase I